MREAERPRGFAERVPAEIRRAREEAGLTQADLARLMGVTQPAVAQLEGRTSNPTVRTLARVAVALGMRASFELGPIRSEREVAVGIEIDRIEVAVAPAEGDEPAAVAVIFGDTELRLSARAAGELARALDLGARIASRSPEGRAIERRLWLIKGGG